MFAGTVAQLIEVSEHVYKQAIANTVNSGKFARVLFSRNFARAKFRENKTLAKWHNLSVIY